MRFDLKSPDPDGAPPALDNCGAAKRTAIRIQKHLLKEEYLLSRRSGTDGLASRKWFVVAELSRQRHTDLAKQASEAKAGDFHAIW